MFFSKSTRGFYSPKIHAQMPADAIEIPNEQYVNLLAAQSQGKIIWSDEGGNPIAIDPPSQSQAVLLEQVKSSLRTQRIPALDALTGMAGREARKAVRWRQEQAQAIEQGSTHLAQDLGEQIATAEALAAEADELAQALLDITDDADLNAAATLEAMTAAGLAEYRRIAGMANPELRSAFKEVDA